MKPFLWGLALGLALMGTAPAVASPLAEAVLVLEDRARDRRVEVLLIYPIGGEEIPLVVFSPGFLFSGPAYRSWAELFAAHGMATALLSYAYSLFNPDHRVLVQDLLFALESLPKEAARRGVPLDGKRVALVGHSLGGKLSVLGAAERGVLAVVGLDPVDGGAPGVVDPVRFPSAVAALGAVRAPLLLIGAEYGERTRFGMPCAPPEANFRRFFAAAQGPALEITQLGAGHLDYLDNPECGFLCSLCWPGSRPDAARAWAQTYALLFLRRHLRGEGQAYSELLALLARQEAEGLVRFRKKPENPGP